MAAIINAPGEKSEPPMTKGRQSVIGGDRSPHHHLLDAFVDSFCRRHDISRAAAVDVDVDAAAVSDDGVGGGYTVSASIARLLAAQFSFGSVLSSPLAAVPRWVIKRRLTIRVVALAWLSHRSVCLPVGDRTSGQLFHVLTSVFALLYSRCLTKGSLATVW